MAMISSPSEVGPMWTHTHSLCKHQTAHTGPESNTCLTYLFIRRIIDWSVAKSGRSLGSSCQHRWTICCTASSAQSNSMAGRKLCWQTLYTISAQVDKNINNQLLDTGELAQTWTTFRPSTFGTERNVFAQVEGALSQNDFVCYYSETVNITLEIKAKEKGKR